MSVNQEREYNRIMKEWEHYCTICHGDTRDCIDTEEHNTAVALGKAIDVDRIYHTFPGFGILADCAHDIILTLDTLGYKIVKKED